MSIDPFTGRTPRKPPARFDDVALDFRSMGVWTANAERYICSNGATQGSAAWTRKRNKRAKQLWAWYYAHRRCADAPHCSCAAGDATLDYFGANHAADCRRCLAFGVKPPCNNN